MERISFLLPGGAQVSCLLNPEEIVMARDSGGQVHRTIGAALTGQNDPFLRGSGGATRVILKLLFDATLSRENGRVQDVREWTAPLWKLSSEAGKHLDSAKKVLLIWGKSWNIPGDIEAISERLEQFTPSGTPQRAWLTLSFVASEGSASGAGGTRSFPLAK